MKKLVKVSAFILFGINTSVFAQTNGIKAGFSNAFLGHFNLNYERALPQNQALLFKFGYLKPTASPFIDEKTITPSAYILEESKGGINTSLEYRFYVTGSRPMLGLYIAPYLRYLNQSMDYSDEISSRDFLVDFRLNTFGVGAQLGYQMLIEERILLDFYFFGAGLDRHFVHLKYRLKQPDPGFDYGTITSDVSEVFQDIDYLHKRLEHEVNDDNLTTRLPFFFPGFRIGISVGVVF